MFEKCTNVYCTFWNHQNLADCHVKQGGKEIGDLNIFFTLAYALNNSIAVVPYFR